MTTFQRILAVLGAVLAAGITIAVIDDDGPGPHRGGSIHIGPSTVAVDGADADTKRDDTVKLDQDGRELVGRLVESDRGDLAAGELRGNDPTQAGVIEGPLAAQEWPGCRTAFARNFSSRNGSSPRIIVWHQTVSHENGLSSQNALTARASDTRAQVSWHFLIGRSNGLCTYTVPTQYKAWHGGNANPFSIGIEVEAYGDEPSYVTGAGKAKLLAVTARIARIYGIPLRRGAVSNCQPVRSGIVEHHDLGVCGGGHVDVCSINVCNHGGNETLPWSIDPLIRELAAQGTCDVRCKRVAYIRGKHQRTHRRFVKNHCSRRGPNGGVRHGYCDLLRLRNARMHRAAEAENINLKGTYR